MKIKAKPYGKKYRLDQQSDIFELSFGATGLHLIVIAATTMFTDVYIDIHFADVIGFQYLDERDFDKFFESKDINSNHHIYKILSGGWLNGDFLKESILSELEPLEWFIKTTNGCMSVLSSDEPIIREFSNMSISSK